MSSKDSKIGTTAENTSGNDTPPVIGDWEWDEFGSFESKMDRLGGALGITFFSVLLLTALAAYEAFNITPDTWFRADYKWVLTSAAGLFASLGVLMALRKSGMRREGRTSADVTKTVSIVLLNIAALVASGTVFGWIIYNWIEGTASSRPEMLYFGSTVGIALVMASLSISGKGTSFDRVASVSLAGMSTGVFLLPLVAGVELVSEQNLVTVLYVIAAFASMVGGLVTLRTSRIRYRAEEPGRRYGVLMGLSILAVGVLAFYADSSGEADVLLRDTRWLLPPIVGLAVSLLVLADSRSVGVRRSETISFLAALVSAVCIAVPAFDMLGVATFDEISWLYPLSLVFVPLCMLAAFGVGRNRAKVPLLSLVLSAMPALLFLLVWPGGLFDGSSLDAAWGLLALYSAGFVFVVVSGFDAGSAIVRRDFANLARFMRIAFVSVLIVSAVAAYLAGSTWATDHAEYLHMIMWVLPLVAGAVISATVLTMTVLAGKERSLPILALSAGALVLLTVLMAALSGWLDGFWSGQAFDIDLWMVLLVAGAIISAAMLVMTVLAGKERSLLVLALSAGALVSSIVLAIVLSGWLDGFWSDPVFGMDLWAIPLVAWVCTSAVVLVITVLAGKGRSLPVLALSAGALVLSVVLAMALSGWLAGLWSGPVFESDHLQLAYPLSVLFGMSLASISLGLSRVGTRRDLVLIATTALMAPLVIYASIHSAEAEIPSMGSLLVASVLVLFSSFRLHTWYSGALVTREKISINIRNLTKISRQVMKNPMGAIGIGILVFFVFIAIFGPSLASEKITNPSGAGSFDRLLPQSSEHWMGTDNKGFDIFSQLLYGGRTSMIVGITAAMIASILGASIGLYSGYVGGWRDEAIMRLNDVVLSIPWLVLMIIIAAYMGEINLLGIILIIGLTGWSATARLVRAQVLSLRERQFVERARAIGCSDGAIIRRHILPNSFPLVFANTILTVAVAILSEATLSFLRMRPNDVVTWGAMLSEAFESSAFYIGLHWWIIAPGLCIVLVVLGFTLIGFALDEILNPKLRKR